MNGLIQTEISTNKNVSFILIHSNFIKSHFEKIIQKVEGYSCCADKTKTIIRRLIDFYKNGEKIEFNYNQEYTFHLPKTIFKTHEEIIEFYERLRYLYYGNSEKYLNALINLKKKIKENE